MLRYLAGRLFRAILTIFLVITFAFFVLHLSGDPAVAAWRAAAARRQVRRLRHHAGNRHQRAARSLELGQSG